MTKAIQDEASAKPSPSVRKERGTTRNREAVLPRFSLDDLTLGKMIGRGEFGEVLEITDIAASADDVQSLSFPINERYVLKRLKKNFISSRDILSLSDHHSRQLTNHKGKNHRASAIMAATDLANECRFLASFSHPNIIRLRGVVGTPGKIHNPKVGLILDRLSTSLDAKLADWEQQQRQPPHQQKPFRNNSGGSHFPGFLGRKRGLKNSPVSSTTRKSASCEVQSPEQMQHQRHMKSLLVMYETACAMKYLHDNKVLFRDLKPANIGFDPNGQVKLFDFGMAKELLLEDRVDVDTYKLTGATGSPRYMAPEVHAGLPYGQPVDVYSFAIVCWEVASLRVPFSAYNSQELYYQVIRENERPPMKKAAWLPKPVRDLVEQCWDADPRSRPDFDAVIGHLIRINRGNKGLDVSKISKLQKKKNDQFANFCGSQPSHTYPTKRLDVVNCCQGCCTEAKSFLLGEAHDARRPGTVATATSTVMATEGEESSVGGEYLHIY